MALIVKFLIKLVIITLFVYDIYDLKNNRLYKQLEISKVEHPQKQMLKDMLGLSDNHFYIKKFIQEFEAICNIKNIEEIFPKLKSYDLNCEALIDMYSFLMIFALLYNLFYNNFISLILLVLDNILKLYLLVNVYILTINYEDFIGHLKMCFDDLVHEHYEDLYFRHNKFTKDNKFLFICIVYTYFTLMLISLTVIKYNKNKIYYVTGLNKRKRIHSENSSN